MKELTTYIIEKFKINKKTKGDAPKITNLSDKYSVGDICLKIVDTGIRPQKRVYIDAIKITNVTKTKLEYAYVTNINDKGTRFIQMKRNDVSRINDYNYFFTSGMTSTTIIVTREDSINILKQIKKDNYKFDTYKSLHKSSNTVESDLIPVMQAKECGVTYNGYSDFTSFTDESYNKLLQAYDKS